MSNFFRATYQYPQLLKFQIEVPKSLGFRHAMPTETALGIHQFLGILAGPRGNDLWPVFEQNFGFYPQ